MRIRKEFKPDMVATKDETRSGINAPFLKDGELRATDGKQLAVFPVESEAGDVEGHIPSEAFAKARAIAMRKKSRWQIPSDHAQITLNKAAAVLRDPEKDQTLVIRRRDQGQFPTTADSLFPTGPTMDIAINIEMLFNLVQALGSAGPAVLRFKMKDGVVDQTAPIEVSPFRSNYSATPNPPAAHGLVMPMVLPLDREAPAFRDRKKCRESLETAGGTYSCELAKGHEGDHQGAPALPVAA